jgi:hypothetical protein
MLTRSTPLKLAKLVLIGSLLFSAESYVFILVCLAAPGRAARMPHFLSALYMAGILLPFFSGALLAGYSYRCIDSGLIESRWTDREVEATYQWLISAGFKRLEKWIKLTLLSTWAGWLLFCIALYALKGRSFQEVSGMFIGVIFLGEPRRALSALKSKLRPVPPTPDPKGGWAGTIKGIHSDHWGGRASADPH